MAFRAAESRGEKCLDQFPSESVAHDAAAEADHVHVVVLDALARREAFVNQAGPDPGHFVGGNRSPNAASAYGHAALHFAAGNGVRQRRDKIRIIVVRYWLLVAEIDHFM